MNDDALFTYYRGRGKMQIVPRNGKGWASFLLYMAIVMLPTVPLIIWGERVGVWLIAAYVVVTLVITFLWVRWAISRSKRVDLDDLDRNYPEYLEWKRRHRRD